MLSQAMKLLAFVLLGVASNPSFSAASAAQEQPAQPFGLPKAKLAELGDKLEQLAEQYHIPGMSAAVVHKGALAWSRGFGFADIEHDVQAEPDTRFSIASVSKPIGAVLVLQLVEQKKLSLDAPMKDFHIYRWFAPDPERYKQQPILVRHVLTHTSEGVPGEKFAYNGNTYFDLTWVLEDVTRTAYPRLLQERIFDPCGMHRSASGYVVPGTTQLIEMARPFSYNRERDEWVPETYEMLDPDPAVDVSDWKVVLRMPEESIAERKAFLGAAFMHLNGGNTAAEVTTTVLDLAKFDIALDGGRLLEAETRELMWTPAVSSANKKVSYGLGWFVEQFAGRKVLWHSGLQPPCASGLYLKVPEAELSFFALACNEGLSAPFPMFEEGVRSSAFAHAFLDTFGLLEE
jgi:CubicO group peptidase (beta-lactamase class C family)